MQGRYKLQLTIVGIFGVFSCCALVWQGNSAHQNQHDQSSSLAHFQKLHQAESRGDSKSEVSLVSQQSPQSKQKTSLNLPPELLSICPGCEEIQSGQPMTCEQGCPAPLNIDSSGSNSSKNVADEKVSESCTNSEIELTAHSSSSKHQAHNKKEPYPPAVQFVMNEAHSKCFENDPYPSAKKCQQCHPGHYREWSVSPHAYAQVSPIFNAMSNKLIKLNNGTLGDFCIRCHTPVGMAMNEPINTSNINRHPSAREGVTCVVCHRMNQAWGKGSGRQSLIVGGVNTPIVGPTGGTILQDVLANPDKYGVMKTSPDSDERARVVHGEVLPFFQMSTSSVCGSCHDVFAPNGFRLEDAFSEFKASPAAREKHQSCQDCHMGIQPGVASGYAFGPAAEVGNVSTPDRKRTSHMFIGPDYSIVHPAIFPHNPDVIKETHSSQLDDPDNQGLATIDEWLLFDPDSGWGTIEFEHNLPKDYLFPEPWKNQAKRFRARDLLNQQYKLLKEANLARHQILSTGYRMGDIELTSLDAHGIKFRVKVFNGTDGHSVPTGFDAERLVFLRVTVVDRQGKVVFVSGDLDPNGDIRDSHSFYVHNGELPIDRQLFSLQTRFVTRNIRGGEREQILNVPYSLDPLPYLRPETRPFTVLGRPLGARKHKQNLEVGGHRYANYHIQPQQLSGKGPYRAYVQLITGMVPVNLIHEISSVGFDYGMSAKEIAEKVVEGHQVMHQRTAVFRIHQK